ncbi:MAG: hypothetical protein AAGC55_13955 [Myxococcota bacterium]
MIVRVKSGPGEAEDGYIALWARELGVWAPIGNQVYETAHEATEVCRLHFLEDMWMFADKAQLLSDTAGLIDHEPGPRDILVDIYGEQCHRDDSGALILPEDRRRPTQTHTGPAADRIRELLATHELARDALVQAMDPGEGIDPDRAADVIIDGIREEPLRTLAAVADKTPEALQAVAMLMAQVSRL